VDKKIISRGQDNFINSQINIPNYVKCKAVANVRIKKVYQNALIVHNHFVMIKQNYLRLNVINLLLTNGQMREKLRHAIPPMTVVTLLGTSSGGVGKF